MDWLNNINWTLLVIFVIYGFVIYCFGIIRGYNEGLFDAEEADGEFARAIREIFGGEHDNDDSEV